MTKLIILGTAHAIPDSMHENTHMAFIGKERKILVDCASNPTVHLSKFGIDAHKVTDLILTHFHPDHVSGVPSLLMNSWLLGREELLNIYGLDHTLDRLEMLMDAYDWKEWPNFFPVVLHRLPEKELEPVIEDDEFRIFASLVCHMIPTIGIRVESVGTGKIVVYTADTEPCEAVLNLGKDADLLIHEATGEGYGHSSARQAALMARKSGAKKLMMIHFIADESTLNSMFHEAQQEFKGEILAATESTQFDF